MTKQSTVKDEQTSEEEAFEKAAQKMWENTDRDHGEETTDGDRD